jgi:signal transduction histidine kinase
MCLAFAWWSILLYTKNQDAYQAKVEILRLGAVAEGLYTDESSFKTSNAFKNLEKEYKRQEWMILGEASLFMISIIIGVWIINNSYTHLIKAAENKRNFLLSITHELKSPIAAALLGIQTIQKRKLNEEQTELISRNAEHELDRLKTLVENLLLAAKVETNYKPIFELENVNQLIANYIERMKMAYPKVSFHSNFDPNHQTAELDRAGLISILGNLIENGIKYSESPANIEVKTKMDDQKFTLVVADNGIGIPEEEKNSVFNKFYRIGSEDTRKTKGTGLGLYIIKEMTAAHSGKVFITDNPEGGTVFTIQLPRFQN